MSSGSSNPSSIFDVKQILRTKLRWFGHTADPPTRSPSLKDHLPGSAMGGHSFSSSSPEDERPSSVNGNRSTPPGIADSHGRLVTSGSAGSDLCHGRKFGESPRSRSCSGGAEATGNSCSCQPACASSPAAWASPTPRSCLVSNMEPSGEASIVDPDISTCNLDTLSSDVSLEPCPEEGVFMAPSHAEVTFRKMESFWNSRRLCDVTLVAGDRQIPAHRLVLSSASDYFAAMFNSDMQEAKQDEVKLDGVDPNALWVLVQYAYTGRLELQEGTIESLLSASCLLQFSSVIQACSSFLVKQLHSSNCLGISSYANAHSFHDLQRAAHIYAMEHFKDVVKSQEFLLLPVEEMEQMLMSDDINVADEETVATSLLSWVNHDVAARQCHLPQLLAHVRLPLLQAQFLADLERNPLLQDNMICQALLMEGMKYHLLPLRRSLLQSRRTRPRKATVGTMFAVGGMKGVNEASTIEEYCLRRDTWEQVATMSGRRIQFGVAVLEGCLYVVGGRDECKTLDTVERYNPRSKSWSVMVPISTLRHSLGVAVLEGPMYAVGGHNGLSYLSSVERWHPQNRQWSCVASMTTPRSSGGVAVLNKKLYVVGGRDCYSYLKSVECFDPHTNRWNECAPMAEQRVGLGVGTWNGFLYAIGGQDASGLQLESVERYDPQTDMWTPMAPMSIGRNAVGVCLLGERLYAVGGHNGQAYLNKVEAYDPQTNEWTQVASLHLCQAGSGVVAVKL
ncbi:kelch-like protein 5 isoform X1 [Stigmatopora nigra]